MDKAGAAEEGQRSAVSEQTPQEPRSVGNVEFSVFSRIIPSL